MAKRKEAKKEQSKKVDDMGKRKRQEASMVVRDGQQPTKVAGAKAVGKKAMTMRNNRS